MRFGQFLVARGAVTVEQVVLALTHQRKQRQPFGRVCLDTGVLDMEQVFDVLNLQSAIEQDLFGDICVELGYLTRTQVDDVVERQRMTAPRLGDVLVSQRSLTSEQLDELLADFQSTS